MMDRNWLREVRGTVKYEWKEALAWDSLFMFKVGSFLATETPTRSNNIVMCDP